MRCTHCGQENDDALKFCVNCGQPVGVQRQPVNSGEPAYQAPPVAKNLPMDRENPDLVQFGITPADGEKTAKTYLCTYYRSRLLGLKAYGNLAVTNKRVVFHALSSGSTGRSIIQSEIPIENVSGLRSYKGNHFSLSVMLGVVLFSAVLGSLAVALISLIKSDNNDLGIALGWISGFAAFFCSFIIANTKIWRPVLVFVSSAIIGSMGAGGLISSITSLFNPMAAIFGYRQQPDIGTILIAIVSLGILVYGFVIASQYARRPEFSLEISSTGGGNVPISITGGGGFLSSAVSRALNAEPAKDTEQMLSELGALVLDIQKLGDFGVEKWRGK